MQHIIYLKSKGKRAFYFAGSFGISKATYTKVDLNQLAKQELSALWKSSEHEEIEAEGMTALELSNFLARYYNGKFAETNGNTVADKYQGIIAGDKVKKLPIEPSGNYYVINKAGDTYLEKDMAISNGKVWERIPFNGDKIPLNHVDGLDKVLQDKLGSTDTATNSTRVGGLTVEQIVDKITSIVQEYVAPIIQTVNKQTQSINSKEDHSNRGVPNGYPKLDQDGKLHSDHRAGVLTINGKSGNVNLLETDNVKFEIKENGISIHSYQPLPIGGVIREGMVRLSVEAIDPFNPVAVGDNDPRLSDARKPTGEARGDLRGDWSQPIIRDGIVNDAKIGTRKINGTELTITEHLTTLYDIAQRHAGIIIGPKAAMAPIIVNPLPNVVNELQLVASNNLSDVNAESARFNIGAVGYNELQASNKQITDVINDLKSKFEAHCNEDFIIPPPVIQADSISDEMIGARSIWGQKLPLSKIIHVISEDLDDTDAQIKLLNSRIVQVSEALIKESTSLSEVLNVPQLDRNKNLTDLLDINKAKNALKLGTLADQNHNNVDIGGGSIVVDYLTTKVANILNGGANLKWLKVNGQQVVGERVGGFIPVPEASESIDIENQVAILTNTLNQLLKALANHGLIGE